MSIDITDILSDWEFDPDDQYRVVQARDGREVLQVRQPLGIEQYELDGRPDGDVPFGKESILDEVNDRLSAYLHRHGNDAGFKIDRDDFALLQNEGVLYYYRYYILFQIGDYERTSMDTDHNLKICEIVERYAHRDDKNDISSSVPISADERRGPRHGAAWRGPESPGLRGDGAGNRKRSAACPRWTRRRSTSNGCGRCSTCAPRSGNSRPGRCARRSTGCATSCATRSAMSEYERALNSATASAT